MKQSITWKIGGEAGFGIISSGTMFTRAFARQGYHALATNEYPSLIRGGHNIITVRVAAKPFGSLIRGIDVLTALDRETVEIHKSELNPGAVVIFDPKDGELSPSDFSVQVVLVSMPFTETVKKLGVSPVMRNTVAMGATFAVLGADFTHLENVIRDQFGKKGDAVVSENISAAREGYETAKAALNGNTDMYLTPPESQTSSYVMNASEAMGLGALEAGMKFAAIYPMTPINALISFFADNAEKTGIVYKQPEDEIAGIIMASGASLAGARSMVATSGGGFALMVEGLSMDGIIEVPMVIDLGMRVGPATGMPTWTEQGELQFVIHAGHGEFPRIVLAPADASEAYGLTIDAFELADAYQVPVFVLTDKYINESQWCVAPSVFDKKAPKNPGRVANPEEIPTDGSFKRYSLDTKDGISIRSLAGMKGGEFLANSYEHDEQGFTTEDSQMRVRMADKRFRKMAAIQKAVMAPQVYGSNDADITFVSFGSTRGPIREAMGMLDGRGTKTRLVHFPWLYPFPTEAATSLLGNAKRIITVEQNGTGQLASLIREHTGIEITEKILKYDGRQLYPEEIVGRLAG